MEIILSDDSSDDTIIMPPESENNSDEALVADIVKKYISVSDQSSSAKSDDYSHSLSSQNINQYVELSDDELYESPPTKKIKTPIEPDDELNDIETLQLLSEKYKPSFNSSHSGEEEIMHVMNSKDDQPLTAKEKKQMEKELIKQQRIEERERKKAEKEREKSVKQLLQSANRNIKPGECMKFISVLMDNELINQEYGQDIVNGLQEANVSYKINSQLFPYSVSWIRKVQKHCMDDNGKLISSTEDQETNEILLIMNYEDLVKHVSNNTLVSHIQSIQSVIINKKIILAIFGLKKYLRYQTNQEQKEYKAQISDEEPKQAKTSKAFRDCPQISKRTIELALTNLQITCNCSHRLVDTTSEVGSLVFQITKSVAELPFKEQRQEKYQKTEWFASGDNRDCVKVDKNGNGLQRLWHQALITFPLASLETAEAISSRYPTVKCLMEAYETCSQTEAEELLQDITVRRAAGPLANARRIGPELSKKIYNFFNSIDGDIFI